MSELLQEFVHSSSERLRVDREAGIIRGVKLLGLVSRNGRRYREDALSQAIALYEGAKVNINHPKGHPLAPRDYQERLGVVRGVVLRPGEGLFGDLHFNPKHSLSEQLVWDAEHAPQNVGMSHNVLARTTRDGADTVVESITKVNSIDLVADPATTSGLYEQAIGTSAVEQQRSSGVAEEANSSTSTPLPHYSTTALSSLTLEQLRQHRPDLVREVQRDYESQLEQVRGELDALVARDKIARRRERILELLQEHNLPLPPTTGADDSQLISREFIESLMRAADDETLQQLVEARAELVRSASQWTNQRHTPDRRPRSRDQMAVEPTGRTCSTKEFVAALRDR
jgi:hypothetical protein